MNQTAQPAGLKSSKLPASEDVRLALRAATMYHLEGATQAEIAAKLGVSRPTAGRLLARARTQGLVRVEIMVPPELEGSVNTELESKLEKHFGLAEVLIVPEANSDSDDPDFDFLQGMDQFNLDEFAAASDSEERLAAFLQPFVDMVHSDPDALIDEIASHLPASDQEVARRPAHRAVARVSLVESVRQGSRGWADDDRAFAVGWGFALSEAACETRLWQGELDVLVPRAHCTYQAERLPNARFELVPGAGHALADHWQDILAWLGGH